MRSLHDASTRFTQTADDPFSKFTRQDMLALFLDSAQRYSLPMAAWRLPGQDHSQMILDLSGRPDQVNIDLENLPPGFIYSPFDHDYSLADARAGFIHADLYFDGRSRKLALSQNLSQATEKAARLKDEMVQRLKNRFTAADFIFSSDSFGQGYQRPVQTNFRDLVARSVRAIEQGAFKKVVPSRCEFTLLPEDFKLVDAFVRMCERYPRAFVSLLAVPGVGVWLGASPEILVRTYAQQGERFFSTIALAGTQKLDEAEDIINASWKIKEIEEQAMVSRYIINCFKKIRLREFDEDGPKTVEAGNLLHLRTDFTVNMDQVNFPELGSVMLKLLHPTSAVCGLPKQPSLEFLKTHEAYDRELFAGFLGPVNVQNEVNVFVNLRCMQLVRDGALLYAGAGVTADSNPEKEWLETVMKMQTLQQVINR